MSSVATSVWEVFFSINLSFPVVIFTFLLVLSLIYWCVAALGLVDIDWLDVDADADAIPDAGSVSGLLMKLGLNGVPITIIISLIAFWGWLISSLAVYYLMPWIPTLPLKLLTAVVILGVSLYSATMLTAYIIKPIRPYFLASLRQKVVELVGRIAVVRTGTVDEHFGEANLDDGGAGLIVKIRAYPGQTLSRGERVVLLERNPIDNTYKVISEQEYQNEI